jgi:FkbM family methyltransferase
MPFETTRFRPERLAALTHRLLRAVEVLGPRAGFKAVIGARRGLALDSLALPGWPVPFTFRGWADAGILGHFFMPGFEVIPAAGETVRRIIDGGANIGAETLRFRRFHPEARILAVEAARPNFDLLMRNVGHDPGIACVHAGLWSSTARLCVEAGPSFEGFHVREAAPGEHGDIDGVGLAGLLEAHGWDEVDIVKLDIEGAEWELFGDTASDWLPRVKVLVFEAPDADRPGTTARILQAFRGLDVSVRIVGEKLCVVRNDTGWRVTGHRALP